MIEAGRAMVLSVAALGALAGPAVGQKLQWADVVYVPGAWQAGRLVPRSTTNTAADTLALVMRVDYFASAPRWRAEIRRSSDGVNFGEPTVLLGERTSASVVTQLGATPLDQHALGRDLLVRSAIVFDANGRRTGVASGRIVDRAANGTVVRVAFRRSQRTANFSDDLLNPRGPSAGRQLIASRLTSVGDQRSASVVATAGARGVDRVRTPRGEVPVRPDSMAIVRMEHFSVGAMRLEDFLRQGGLGPYKPAEGQRP